MTTQQDQAIEILSLTSDGNSLTRKDLALVQLAANSHLNEAGDVALAKLLADVQSGEYFKSGRWFHGIENLTQDHEGYVYWRGISIEHYSFDDPEASAKAAGELTEKCRMLEAKGFPVTGRTVLSRCVIEAPTDTPWMLPMQRYYTFFESPSGIVSGIFYLKSKDPKTGDYDVAIVTKEGDSVVVTPAEGAYEAFHLLQGAGQTSMGTIDGYADFLSRIERLGIGPDALNQIIDPLSTVEAG